jgi:endoglucanase Acf2
MVANRTKRRSLPHRGAFAAALGAGAMLACGSCGAYRPWNDPSSADVSPSAPRPLAVFNVGSAGAYVTQTTGAPIGPTDLAGKPSVPKVTTDFAQVPMTTDWWASLLWPQDDDPYSGPMFPHPLSTKACPEGLELGYRPEPVIAFRRFLYPHHADLVVGVEGLRARAARVQSYTDWTVTAEWADAAHSMRVTIGHGLPYAFVSDVHGRARVTLDAPDAEGTIWSRRDNVVAVTVNGQAYVLVAPIGSSWTAEGRALVADVGPGGFYSVGLLPERSDAALALVRRHALAFVRDTQVSWTYDRAGAAVISRYALRTEPMVKSGDYSADPLVALYPHQWKHSDVATAPFTYASARGVMKLAETAAFETRLPMGGLLPALPEGGRWDPSRLASYLAYAVNGPAFPAGAEGTRDSYWEGESFGREAELVRVADEANRPDLRDKVIRDIEAELEDWFDGRAPRYFYYDERWRTLVGVPTMYGSGSQLNDHHFHYGYFVFAAATVAQYDRAWADRHAAMVELLIRDANNPDRADTRFPFLRHFDPYEGHSWASGTGTAAWGNNEESSSEEINFAAATALWGTVMGRDDLRDLGLFLFANGQCAIEQYWFDVDHDNFPKGYGSPFVGILWGAGGMYSTWFSTQPAFILGIQLTPMGVGALRFGRHPDVMRRVLAETEHANEGAIHLWREKAWMLEAEFDPDSAVVQFEAEHAFAPSFGTTLAYVYHWIYSLDRFGRVDPTVTADTPLYGVFRSENRRTYAAYNATPRAAAVTFSDGYSLRVPPLALGRAERVVGP